MRNVCEFRKIRITNVPHDTKKKKILCSLEAGTLANSDLTCSMRNAAAVAGQALATAFQGVVATRGTYPRSLACDTHAAASRIL